MARRVARSASPQVERGPAPKARTSRPATQSPGRSRLESHLRSLSKLQAHVRVEAEIGSGNCSVVLLGKDRSGQEVAVKAISLKAAKTLGTDEQRIWGEVQVMREVQHPNLAHLLDVMASWEPLPLVKAEPPFLCIIMEYLAHAEALSKRIREASLGPVERIVLQLASALARLHRSDIVHRDVWAENILIDRQDKVTLLDFGCAERLQKPATNNKLNLPYMSPESAAGRPHDVGDDAWALGLLITEMVTGRFMADRLGRVDIPVHFQRPALCAALSETVSRCSPILGRLAAQFLDFTAARRPKMAEVVNLLRPGHQKDGDPALPKDARTSRARAEQARNQSPLGFRGRLCTSQCSPLRRPSGLVDISPGRFGRQIQSATRSRPTRNSFGKSTGLQGIQASVGQKQSTSNTGSFKTGQSVLYCPKEAGVKKGVVQGRSADGTGWRIQLENGLCIDVADSEEWRMCLCDPPAPIRPSLQPTQQPVQPAVPTAPAAPARAASAPTDIKGPVLAWAHKEASAARGKVLSTSSTASSLATMTGSSSPEVTDASPMPKSYKIAAVSKPYTAWASTSPMRPATAASKVPLSGVPAKGEAPHPGPLLRARYPYPGQRLFYTARSNGQRYPGVLTGFLPNRPGYRVFLDCGESKEVDEAEAWRLAF